MFKLKSRMKNSLLLLIFFISQITFAQTKVDEYEKIGSDAETGRIDNFLLNLRNEPENKGIIVIYSGESEERIGNILQHVEGIKQYVNLRDENLFAGKIFYQIKQGEQPLFKEFWIYPKNTAIPEIKEKPLNLDNLKTKYLYASICADCEPAVPELSTDIMNYEFYADLLKKYPDYTSSIIIYPFLNTDWSNADSYKNALTYAANYRNVLTKEYKISNKRIFIKISKPFGKDAPTIAKFFIVPKTRKQK